jgi:hypothetical protein
LKLLLWFTALGAVGLACRPDLPDRCGRLLYCEVGTVCGPGDVCLVEADACDQAAEGLACVGSGPSLCRMGDCVPRTPCDSCPEHSECGEGNVCRVKTGACDAATEGLSCHGASLSACRDSQCVPTLCGGQESGQQACIAGTGAFLDVKRAKVAAGDFNGDGRLSDMMVLYDHEKTPAGLWIFPGTEEHRDGASKPYRVWLAEPEYFDVKRAKVASGDFNRDGMSDLLVLQDYDDGSAGLWIFPGTRDQHEGASRPYLVWTAPSPFDLSRAKVTAGDFDGDTWADLIVLSHDHSNSAGLWIFPGGTERRADSSPPYRVWSAGPEAFDVDRANLAAADFNGDHLSDALALYDFGGGESGLWIWPGATSRTPSVGWPRLVWRVADRYVRHPGTDEFNIRLTKVTGGDFNGDGFGDLTVIYDNDPDFTSMGVFVSPGNAGLLDHHYQVGNWPPNGFASRGIQLAAGDFDGDDHGDLLVLYDYTQVGGNPPARLFIFPGAPGATELSDTDYIVWSSSPTGL